VATTADTDVTGDPVEDVAVVRGLAEVIICPVDEAEDEALELIDDEILLLSDEERLELLLDDAEELD
jgi:hypothetical protein